MRVVAVAASTERNKVNQRSPRSVHHLFPQPSFAFIVVREDQLTLPGRGKLGLGSVVSRKSVNPRLDQNETELGVLVVPISLEVLAHGDGLLDEVVEILGDLGGES